MSRTTRPEIEPSVSCGFYNSDGVAGSRKYYASEMSAIFDGIIKDGVFASIGTCFAVEAYSGNTVNVGVGKCWFNHTWTLNDAPLPMDCGEPEQVANYNRIDAIVIEVDSGDAVRDNFIKVIHGQPSVNPARPEMIHTSTLNQYALCYIYRAAGATEITQADITNAVGVETPFVTGILEYVDPETFCKQWVAKIDDFIASEKARTTLEIDAFIDTNESEFDEWYAQMVTLMEDAVNEFNTWSDNQKATMLAWFENMRDQLSEDAAVNLQLQLDESEIKNILLLGFTEGEKVFSDDGTTITSTDSENRTLVKTFTNNFLTITTVLTDRNGTELGRYVKEFSTDGKLINSSISTYPATLLSGDIVAY